MDGTRGTAAATRRALLGSSAIALVGALLVGCTATPPDRTGPTGTTTVSPTVEAPSPDELARDRAAATAVRLLDLARRLVVKGTATALRDRLVAVHQAHLAALGGPPAATGGTTGTATGTTGTATTGTRTTPAPAPAPVSVQALVAAETAAAQEAFDDVATTTPGLATLLARVAAARSLDATLLAQAARLPTPGVPVVPAAAAPTSTPTVPSAVAALTAAERTALERRLAGEHAAVYAYAAVRSQLTGAQAGLADRLWAGHRQRRDALELRLLAAGARPPAAEAAYALGPVRSPAQAVALAARVERGFAELAASDVGLLAGTDRFEAALALVGAARRTAQWTPQPDPLPGRPA